MVQLGDIKYYVFMGLGKYEIFLMRTTVRLFVAVWKTTKSDWATNFQFSLLNFPSNKIYVLFLLWYKLKEKILTKYHSQGKRIWFEWDGVFGDMIWIGESVKVYQADEFYCTFAALKYSMNMSHHLQELSSSSQLSPLLCNNTSLSLRYHLDGGPLTRCFV